MNVSTASHPRRFADRADAGRALAEALLAYAGTDPVVLALPRGGVPVAAEIARVLGGTLDVCVVRKLGVPFEPELGMGAVAEGPAVVVERAIMHAVGVDSLDLITQVQAELEEVRRRVDAFREGRPFPNIRDRVVILVDDGIATGGTMRAVIRSVHRRHPARVVVAVPVGPPATIAALRREVDDVVCLLQPDDLQAIGQWYVDFHQLEDSEVVRTLRECRAAPRGMTHTR
jgi:putative phosphoribosyl transferase